MVAVAAGAGAAPVPVAVATAVITTLIIVFAQRGFPSLAVAVGFMVGLWDPN